MIRNTLRNLRSSSSRRVARLRDGVRYRGSGRFCPVCERAWRRFKPFGDPPRADAQCPHCGSLERHRLLSLFLRQRTDLFDGRPRKMLHVAPEPCLEPVFEAALGSGYFTADLLDPRARLRMDVEAIDLPDGTFDIVYCSHVLEHVPDDRKALGEFHRVLDESGWAILLVPILRESTYEDPTIDTPEGRRRHFGQEDHVRVYGRDYPDRLRGAGFHVEVARVPDLASPAEATRMGLSEAAGDIFYCTR
jgi:SAM-dependent methyltransferase